MDKIINWFMMLIIFVFDPLAIAMVVAANMAFAKLKPKVECSLPEGAEWDKSYPLNDHFNPNDVDELKHWEEEEDSATIEEQSKHTDCEEEIEEEEYIFPLDEELKLPKESKGWIMQAAKHARRRGDKIPEDLDRFFD
jgi:hypothetical protein